MPGDKSHPAAGHILLIALFCVPFFVNLGGNVLCDGTELWHTEPPREMLESGDWLVPYYNYEPWLGKSPLGVWVIGGAYSALGVTEFAGRLPAAWGAHWSRPVPASIRTSTGKCFHG